MNLMPTIVGNKVRKATRKPHTNAQWSNKTE